MFEMSSISCNAGLQSPVPFPDCNVNHWWIKTVLHIYCSSRAAAALPRPWYLILVNAVLQNSPQCTVDGFRSGLLHGHRECGIKFWRHCFSRSTIVPSVLWRCWLGGGKGIRPEKTECWGAGMVICLERGADLHMAQLMPLPLTVSCFSKIQIGFTFLVLAYPGSPGQRAVKRVCVCVCASADRRSPVVDEPRPVLLESEVLRITDSNITKQYNDVVNVRWKFLSKYRENCEICWWKNFENRFTFA